MRRAELAVDDGRDPVVRIDATSVRRRVDELRRAGWTLQGIADAAGVSATTVHRVANRRLRRVALPTHRRLLAVKP
jgi:hypothetical protein